MIDVLSFPPDERALDALRTVRLERCRRLEERGRLALFISLGLFLAWAADVGAAFESAAGALPMAFGLASVVLAVSIAAAHLIARHVLARSHAMRRQVEREFSAVRVCDAQPLITGAVNDRAVAQYLRMVGRQRRALRSIELQSLLTWLERAAIAPTSPPASQPIGELAASPA